jgi:hypothetical protein
MLFGVGTHVTTKQLPHRTHVIGTECYGGHFGRVRISKMSVEILGIGLLVISEKYFCKNQRLAW